VGLGPLIQGSASQGAGTFVYLETGGTQTARHADCRLRGKRRAGIHHRRMLRKLRNRLSAPCWLG